jgi:hypothetical protein
MERVATGFGSQRVMQQYASKRISGSNKLGDRIEVVARFLLCPGGVTRRQLG